jgi:membrane fusion protein (multidrug efflux system)
MQKFFKQPPFNLLTSLLAASVFIQLVSCNSTSGTMMPTQTAPALPVLTLTAQPATTYREFSASLEGTKDIEIRPQVDGIIEKIYVDEGAYVRKGQPLFRINERTYREQYNNAVANLSAARANLANAQISVSKLTPLVENNVISDVQLKTAKASYNAAAAQVAQASALVRNTQISLGYTLIKAPADGYVGRIPLKTGSLVGLTTAEPLTVLSEIKDIYAYFSMSENDFLQFRNQYAGNTIDEKIKQIPPVELVLSDGTVYTQKGKVQTVAGQFNNETGAISFRVVFSNADRFLRSGNTGRIRIPKMMSSALVVPQESTFEIQDKVFVFALGDSNKVISKPITVSGKTPAYYFVENGLKEGDKIVFTGTGNLRDGMPIVPEYISFDSLLKLKPL